MFKSLVLGCACLVSFNLHANECKGSPSSDSMAAAKAPVETQPVREKFEATRSTRERAVAVNADYHHSLLDQIVPDQCIVWPNAEMPYGSITRDVVRSWDAGLHHVASEKYLRLRNDPTSKDGGTVLEQNLVPSKKGSARVIASFDVPDSRIRVVTQSIRFSPNFDWGGKMETGKFGVGIGGGSVPSGGSTGDDGFSARLAWNGNRDGTANLSVYVYSSDRTQNLPWGDTFTVPDFKIPEGQWFDIALVVAANSSPRATDGWFTLLVNDEIRLHKHGIQWQRAGASKPVSDTVVYSTFYGGSDGRWAPKYPNQIQTSNICYSAN